MSISGQDEIHALHAYLNLNMETRRILRSLCLHDVTILKFSANWCQPCKRLSEQLAQDVENSPELYKNVFIIEINVDDESSHEIAAKYEVSSIPLCIVVPNLVSDKIIETAEPTRISGCSLQQIRNAIAECQK